MLIVFEAIKVDPSVIAFSAIFSANALTRAALVLRRTIGNLHERGMTGVRAFLPRPRPMRSDRILEGRKGVHRVDLGESFPTHIDLQTLASIPPRTSPVKFTTAAGCKASSVTIHRARTPWTLS